MPADPPAGAPSAAPSLGRAADRLSPGRVDIHSHLLPGVDDGCADADESLACVRRLKAAGFVGSICTPHIYPAMFPENRIDNIRGWVAALQRRIDTAGLDYRVWAGGELRIADDMIEWMRDHG